MQDIILIGYGGHGKSVEDTIRAMGCYNIIGYTDREEMPGAGIPYLGTDIVLADYAAKGPICAAIGIGFMGKNPELRQKLCGQMKALGLQLPAIIDPSAVIARDAKIADGCYVGKRAVINAGAVVEPNCIINTGAIVEHECSVGQGSHIAVGAVLCGNVTIGKHCFVGANATVLQGVHIGDGAVVGAGSVVLQSVEAGVTVVGAPAKNRSYEDII